MGRRWQAAWDPGLEERRGSESPRCPDCPYLPRTRCCQCLQAGKAKRQMERAPRAACLPSQRARKRVVLQQKTFLTTPTLFQPKTNRKTAESSSEVSVGLKGKLTFHIPFLCPRTRHVPSGPPRRAGSGATQGPQRPSLPRHTGSVPNPQPGQCWARGS